LIEILGGNPASSIYFIPIDAHDFNYPSIVSVKVQPEELLNDPGGHCGSWAIIEGNFYKSYRFKSFLPDGRS